MKALDAVGKIHEKSEREKRKAQRREARNRPKPKYLTMQEVAIREGIRKAKASTLGC